MQSFKQLYQNPNAKGFLFSTIIIVVFVEVVKILAKEGYLQNWQRRKLLHVLTGPIYILTWPFFTSSLEGSQFAAAVPAVMTLKFFLIGVGAIKDQDTVNSACRSGNKSELLRGPLLYGIIFVVSTILYWKRMRAVICLFILCFGDGFAEICGRNYGLRNKLLWCKEKSAAGLIGFIVFSTLFTVLFIRQFGSLVLLPNETYGSDCLLIVRVLFVSVVAGIIETLPIAEIDNVTIVVSAILSDQFITTYPFNVC